MDKDWCWTCGIYPPRNPQQHGEHVYCKGVCEPFGDTESGETT